MAISFGSLMSAGGLLMTNSIEITITTFEVSKKVIAVAVGVVTSTITMFSGGGSGGSSSHKNNSNSSQNMGTGNKWPEGDSQLKHIFGDRQGHIPDTPANRTLLENLSNNMKKYRGVDQHVNQVFMKMLDDGSQIWTFVRYGIIRNGGMNIGEQIRVWIEGVGFIVP